MTAASTGETDTDMPILQAALARTGTAADVVSWDDRRIEWSSYRLVVVRSTWDYVERREEFLAWTEAVAAQTVLANPAPVLRWNTDKRYLEDLADAGVPVVPTTWIEPGDGAQLSYRGEVVVKPAVSAGATDTARYALSDPAEATVARDHVERLLAAGRTVMVQPYCDGVDERGETRLVYIGGIFSHALHQGAILRRPADGADAGEGHRVTSCQPTAEERRVAEATVAAVPVGQQLLYARVDLVPVPGGEPAVLELEATEPSLFLEQVPAAAQTLAASIVGRL